MRCEGIRQNKAQDIIYSINWIGHLQGHAILGLLSNQRSPAQRWISESNHGGLAERGFIIKACAPGAAHEPIVESESKVPTPSLPVIEHFY
jgi:hypothetical protein